MSGWFWDNVAVIFLGLLLEILFLTYHPQVALEPLIASSPWLIKYGETFFLFVAFTPYFLGFLETRRTSRTDPRVVIAFSALFALTLILAVLPTLSADVGGYAFYGKLLPGYGADPYASISRDYPAEPFSTSGTWTRWLNPYGPLWTLVATAVMTAVRGNFFAGVIVFKLLSTLAMFGSVLLLLALRRRLRGEPMEPRTWPTDLLLLFLWNPYVLFEAAHEGHNDFILIFFLAGALWFLANRRNALSAAALAASVSIKYVTVLLLPIFLIAVFKKAGKNRVAGLTAAGGFLLAFAALSAAFAVPFLGGSLFGGLRNQLALIHNSGYYGYFPYFFHTVLMGPPFGMTAFSAAGLAHSICSVLFAITLAGICLVFLLRRTSGDDLLVKACFSSLAAYLLIDSFWFMPWYFLWLAPLAFVTEGYGTFIILTLCGLTATGTYIGPVVSWALLWLLIRPALLTTENKTRQSRWRLTWESLRSRFLGH